MFAVVLIIAFLLLINVITFIKRNKRNKKINEPNSVKQYRKTYADRREAMGKHGDSSSYENYVTKYNSTVDYREK